MRYVVRVQARASRSKVVRNRNGSLKVYLTAPPVEGRANEALKAALSDEFGVKRGRVRIIKGERSKDKVVEI